MWWEKSAELLATVFGSDVPVALTGPQVVARTILVYCFGILIVRLGKNRLMARASALDIIVGFVLGSILARAINGSASLTSSLIACTVLVAAHSAFVALTYRYHWLGYLLKGRPLQLVDNGQLNHANMAKGRISEHDLIEEMHLHAGLDDLQKVHSAYIERNGDVSILPSK